MGREKVGGEGNGVMVADKRQGQTCGKPDSGRARLTPVPNNTFASRLFAISIHSTESTVFSMSLNIKVGDTIPEGTFAYVPYTSELDDGVSTIGFPRLQVF